MFVDRLSGTNGDGGAQRWLLIFYGAECEVKGICCASWTAGPKHGQSCGADLDSLD